MEGLGKLLFLGNERFGEALNAFFELLLASGFIILIHDVVKVVVSSSGRRRRSQSAIMCLLWLESATRDQTQLTCPASPAPRSLACNGPDLRGPLPLHQGHVSSLHRLN